MCSRVLYYDRLFRDHISVTEVIYSWCSHTNENEVFFVNQLLFPLGNMLKCLCE